ncbi:MAG: Asp23/Gls24 family envelope stress response protein [Chlamydiae bacterium]|nr:Asp23/Gls24 family envelope stress response protein [Chlamydiota bacterium]
MHEQIKRMDKKEIELPETEFVWDIESRLFQSLVVRCLSKIEGVGLLEGNLVDALLGRDASDRVKGISVEQDEKLHSIRMKIEINVRYGVSIPDKAEEVQAKVAEEVSLFTGLHVAAVHVVFKNLIPSKQSIEEMVSTED